MAHWREALRLQLDLLWQEVHQKRRAAETPEDTHRWIPQALPPFVFFILVLLFLAVHAAPVRYTQQSSFECGETEFFAFFYSSSIELNHTFCFSLNFNKKQCVLFLKFKAPVCKICYNFFICIFYRCVSVCMNGWKRGRLSLRSGRVDAWQALYKCSPKINILPINTYFF